MIKRENHRGNKSISDMIPKAVSEHKGTLVRIVDWDPAKHLVKVVKLADNRPLLKDQEIEEAPSQKKRYKATGEKVLKTSLSADGPIVSVNDGFASIRGNGDYGFFSYKEGGGNIIKGPLSLAVEPQQVRISGLTTLNPLATSGFPSTIVTPIPMTTWALPTAAAIKPILKDVLVMGTLLAAVGSVV
jgi:hypothetical protein